MPVNPTAMELKIAENEITLMVCSLLVTTGHIGMFASLYPFRLWGISDNDKICNGIQQRTKIAIEIEIMSIVPITADLPAIKGKLPATPPKIIEYLVFRFNHIEYITTSKKKPKKTAIIEKMLMKIPTISTPETVSIIPYFRTVEEEILPDGIGLFFVRSIISSISLSMTMFRRVEPEIAKNKPTLSHKIVLTTIPVVVHALIKYVKIAVYNKRSVCLLLIKSEIIEREKEEEKDVIFV